MNTKLFTFILGSLMLLSIVAYSQPTITAAGTNPNLGETVTSYSGAFQNPGAAGANQTWDFSALAGAPSELFTCVSSATTANASSFPNSNVAMSSSPSTIRYFRTSNAALENHGTFASNVVIPFTDPEALLHFPFTNGNSYTDTWSGEYTTSYLIYRSGTSTVTADAYGTMITPAGTFTNVLRVHHVQAYQDSFDLGLPFIITYTSDNYFWYQEGFHNAVASTYSFNSSSGLTASGAAYYSAGPVGVAPASELIAAAELFPNPAADQMTLEMNLTKSCDISVLIFNSLGQQVEARNSGKNSPGLFRLQMAVDQLPEGIYFAKIMLNGQLETTKRFVVAR